MLSFSHILIIVMAVIIFVGPDKIPQFFKNLAEGMAIFRKTFTDTLEKDNSAKNKNDSANHQDNKKNKSKKIKKEPKKKLKKKLKTPSKKVKAKKTSKKKK